MGFLDLLKWKDIRAHYKIRKDVHRKLIQLLAAGSVRDFTDLALGISSADGNYSANEHSLGPKIIGASPRTVVFNLAAEFSQLTNGHDVPPLIRSYAIPNLKIGVGSEISCMVNPRVCWVANTRTIWTHLVFKHNDLAKADEELELYRDEDITSEMAYRKWQALHRSVVTSMQTIANDGAALARAKHVKPGAVVYLWADAIASALYGHHHG